MVYFTTCKDDKLFVCLINQVSESLLEHNGLFVGIKCVGQKNGRLIFLTLI